MTIIILWTLAVICAVAFCYFHLIPYIKFQVSLFFMERTFKKMAKKYDGEARDKLIELAEAISVLRKEDEL